MPATDHATNEPRILDHDCDGIREYDNPMPFWLTATFWITMIFAVPYFAFYHLGGVGTSLGESYETEVGEFYEMQAARLGNLKPDEATILTLSEDKKKLLAGQNMFKANCATCHAPDGGGKTGPNLTDDFYINVRTPEDIFRVVRDGVEVLLQLGHHLARQGVEGIGAVQAQVHDAPGVLGFLHSSGSHGLSLSRVRAIGTSGSCRSRSWGSARSGCRAAPCSPPAATCNVRSVRPR